MIILINTSFFVQTLICFIILAYNAHACTVPQDGCALLHHQGEGEAGKAC